MPHCEDSICLLTSTDPDNRAFGTGFVFHRDGTGRSFLLTCLHVIEALEKPRKGSGSEPPGVLADGLVAEVWARGDAVLDLAVLAVDGLSMEPLRLGAPIVPDRPIQTAGYTDYEPAQQSMVPPTLKGTVRGRNPVKTRLHPGRVGAWALDIEIELDPFRELTEGYSGSPVVDLHSTEVVGIMNLKRTGRKGHAICVGSFKLLFEKPDARSIPDYSYASAVERRTTQGIGARSLPEKFLVAFSFAGEQRQLVRAIAQSVEARLGQGTVFFDEWYEFWLAGADADLKLQDLYAKRCALAVVCVSGPYGEKPWTRAEHQAIRARQMQSLGSSNPNERDAILPIRVGDGEVPGVTFNAVVPDVRERPSEQTAELILQRLRYLAPGVEPDPDRRRGARSVPVAEGSLAWLASTLDHTDPIEHVAIGLDAQYPGLWFYAFDAYLSDCPRALAEHLAVEFGGLSPAAPGLDELVTELHPLHFDEAGLWKALVAKVSPSTSGPGRVDEADRILNWINAGPTGSPGGPRVVYCELSVADTGSRISGFIEGAIKAFSNLNGRRENARVLFLFACIYEETGLRRLLDHWRRPRLRTCEPLGALAKLRQMDLNTWLSKVADARPGGRRLDDHTQKRLRDALEPLFPNDAARLRYKQIHRPALDILAQATLIAATPGDPP